MGSTASREQPPLARHALQHVGPSIFELDPRSEYQVLDRGRYEDLAGPSKTHDASSDVHCQPADVIADQLNLSRVYSGADFQAQTAYLAADCLRA